MIESVLKHLIETGAVAELGSVAWLYLGLWNYLDPTEGPDVVAHVVQTSVARSLGRSRTRVNADLKLLETLGFIRRLPSHPHDNRTRYALATREPEPDGGRTLRLPTLTAEAEAPREGCCRPVYGACVTTAGTPVSIGDAPPAGTPVSDGDGIAGTPVSIRDGVAGGDTPVADEPLTTRASAPAENRIFSEFGVRTQRDPLRGSSEESLRDSTQPRSQTRTRKPLWRAADAAIASSNIEAEGGESIGDPPEPLAPQGFSEGSCGPSTLEPEPPTPAAPPSPDLDSPPTGPAVEPEGPGNAPDRLGSARATALAAGAARRAASVARATAGVSKLGKAAQSAANLKGKVYSNGTHAQIARVYEAWRAASELWNPEGIVEVWGPAERGKVTDLLTRYGEQAVLDGVRHFVGDWTGLQPKVFSGREAVPTMRTLHVMHGTIIPQAQMIAKARATLAAYDRWYDEHPGALPDETMHKAIVAATNQLKTVGATR